MYDYTSYKRYRVPLFINQNNYTVGYLCHIDGVA